MLKPPTSVSIDRGIPKQPPPRGCVLKHLSNLAKSDSISAAASARLCVETDIVSWSLVSPAAAASARLCVETALYAANEEMPKSSRLRAAVC